MMKYVLGVLAFFLFTACFAQAQGKVSVAVSGNGRGSVPSVELNGVTYVDVQKMARKVGAGVELFAQSKQVKITARGFYAILTVSLPEIIVNARPSKLEAPVVIQGGAVMAPVSFFTRKDLQKALQQEISFSKNTLWIERPFDLERVENIVNARENELVFNARRQDITWSVQEPNKHTVEVSFPNTVFKRDEHFRFRTDFIASADLYQNRGNAVLKVILGKSAKDWRMIQQGSKLIFRVGALPPESPVEESAKPSSLVQAGEASSLTVAPSVLAEEGAETIATPTPSVLTEEDGFEEMFPADSTTVMQADEQLEISSTPVMKEAPEAEPSAVPVMQAAAATVPSGTPVMKAEPQTLRMSAEKRKIRIVVDPGHGGKDAGAVRGRYREKEWNLAVGNELARLLKKGGFEVKVTRSTDVFIALGERAKISNEFKADLFVSIHTNATKKTQANGFQVYFRSEKATDKEAAETAALENEAMQYEEAHYNFVDALLQSMVKNEFINESSKLAGYVRNAVYKQPGIGIAVNQNSSVRQANFYVLKGVNSPSILIEMGFISSPKDRARLSNKAAREKMALGIYNGIVNYTKKEIK